MREIKLSDKAIEFLQILSQQTISLPKMFNEWHWTRWNPQELEQILKEIREATR